MTRSLLLAILPLALASAAMAQLPSAGVDWSQPVVVGVDGYSAQRPDIAKSTVDLTGKNALATAEEELARNWEQHQASYSHRQHPEFLPVLPVTAEDIVAAADTPLPPPCEAPIPRSPQPPGPPAPAPAPCRP